MSQPDARDFWDARFAGDDYLFGAKPNAFLESQAHRLRAGWRALALADGEGRNGVWLAEQGLDVTSVDISPRGVAKARRLAAERGVALTLRVADVADWDMGDAAYDVAAAIFIQFAAPNLRAILFQRLKRAIRPGGLAIVHGYRPEQIGYGTGGPPQAENMYDEALLRAAFGGFEILHLRSHDDVAREGGGHDGMSALIDLVARRPARAIGA